jgi:hypothetical protein
MRRGLSEGVQRHIGKAKSWILLKQIKVSGPAPLMEWIAAWRGSGTAASAYAEWQKAHALPWLVLALAKADSSDAFAPALIEEAAKIAPAHPVYDTAFFHRVRLLVNLHRADEARTLLDDRLPALRNQKPGSTLNALLGQRMAVARDFNEFLIYAPRTALRTGSEGAEDLRALCNERAHAQNQEADCPELKLPLQFDGDSVAVLNRHVPLARLVEASKSSSLPGNLRQDLYDCRLDPCPFCWKMPQLLRNWLLNFPNPSERRPAAVSNSPLR